MYVMVKNVETLLVLLPLPKEVVGHQESAHHEERIDGVGTHHRQQCHPRAEPLYNKYLIISSKELARDVAFQLTHIGKVDGVGVRREYLEEVRVHQDYPGGAQDSHAVQ